MFYKSLMAKFEWSGLPEPLNELFVENLLLNSTTYNFAVSKHGEDEFWSYFSVVGWEKKYRIPIRIIQTYGMGGTIESERENFVLFTDFKYNTVAPQFYIRFYTKMLADINEAIGQHVKASNLICTIRAQNQEEAQTLRKLFGNYKGIIINENRDGLTNPNKPIEIQQFNIRADYTALEQLKKDVISDLLRYIGIDDGMQKTHITDANLTDTEQCLDLINSYELKLRKDFCERYNKKFGGNLSVKIHDIDKTNSLRINEQGGKDNEQVE